MKKTILLLLFLIPFISCRTLLDTKTISSPERIEKTKKSVGKEFGVSLNKEPSHENPSILVDLYYTEEFQYKTRVKQKNQYVSYGYTHKAGVWTAIGSIIGGGCLGWALGALGDDGIQPLVYAGLGFSLFLFDLKKDENKANYFSSISLKRGPKLNYREGPNPLTHTRVNVISNEVTNKFKTDKHGQLEIDFKKYNYPLSTEYKYYSFDFKKNNTSFSNNIVLNSKLWQYRLPKLPPIISIDNIRFIDANNNNAIDFNEDCKITFSINNIGNGDAYNLVISITETNSIKGIEFENKLKIDKIESNTKKDVEILIKGSFFLDEGNSNFLINIEEQNGFNPEPFQIQLKTNSYIEPFINVVDYSFQTESGVIKLGHPIQLKVLVQNLGQGNADEVKVNFNFPDKNVFPNGPVSFNIGSLQSGSSKELVFEFIANRLYFGESIPITVNISEKYNLFSENKTVNAIIEEKSNLSTITFNGSPLDYDRQTKEIKRVSLLSDVDMDIPIVLEKDSYKYALIIGNEDYSSRQRNLSTEVNVPYAVNDAAIFKEYCIKTLGFEENNLFYITNATSAEMHKKIDLVTEIMSRLDGKGELVFFYAGHGYPDEVTREPYLMPVDVSVSNLNHAIKLSDVYSKFSNSNAKRITVFLDACFTGGGRVSGLLAARAVRVRPKKEEISGNMVIFSATNEDQSALPYTIKKHGMFTYFLLKKLKETKGDVDYGSLEEYLRNNVSLESLKINHRIQEPTTKVSLQAKDDWMFWKLR
jgi:hypothetical protein